MNLTIYYDGQFWVGVIEIVENGKLKAYRYIFGKEPKDVEVLHFIEVHLLSFIQKHRQAGIEVSSKEKRKVNPKRLQRQVANEMRKMGISTKAQDAIKQEQEAKKKDRKVFQRNSKEELKDFKYALKKQKAKEKHRGK